MILFIANDFGPSTSLGLVADSIKEQGKPTTCHFGKGLTSNVVLDGTTLLVSGMAFEETAAQNEIALIKKAREQGIPVALYADTWGCAERQWFRDVAPFVTTLFVVNQEEATRVRGQYPHATIYPVGNPLWQMAAFPTRTKEEVRSEFGISYDSIVVLLACRKEDEINRPFLKVCHDALVGMDVEVLVSVHPSAPNREAYKHIVSEYGFRWVDGKSLDILPGVDIVVNTASGTGIEALYMGKPVLEFSAEVVLDEVERLHYSRTWRPVGNGAALPFTSAKELALLVCQLSEKNSTRKSDLLVQAREAYPLPESSDAAVQRMANILLQAV